MEGNQVDKGQLLVELDKSDVELEMLQRKAEVAEIEAQLNSDKKRFDSDKQALESEKSLVDDFRSGSCQSEEAGKIISRHPGNSGYGIER